MKTCKVDGCDGKYYAKGYCVKHYRQIQRHGKILDKTRFDSNEIVTYDDYAEIILYDKNNNEKARAKIDIEDVEKVKEYKWRFSDGYAVTGKTKVGLHRFIMNCPKDMEVDHINRNKLDNRKCNLRVCTKQQNAMNKGLIKSNSSGYTGIYWDKNTNKWRVRITVNKKHINLGYYDNLEEAIKVRKEAEIKYFGEYRNKE